MNNQVILNGSTAYVTVSPRPIFDADFDIDDMVPQHVPDLLYFVTSESVWGLDDTDRTTRLNTVFHPNRPTTTNT